MPVTVRRGREEAVVTMTLVLLLKNQSDKKDK